MQSGLKHRLRRTQDPHNHATVSLNATYTTSPQMTIFSVYYRVYAEDGAIPTFRPVYSDDPYLGRIKATMVALPHTARSLRRCLSSIEHIDPNAPTRLFIAASSQTPMQDAGRVSILANPGPGCTPNEPMVLVAIIPLAIISGPLADRNPELNRLPPEEHLTPCITQYRRRSERSWNCPLN